MTEFEKSIISSLEDIKKELEYIHSAFEQIIELVDIQKYQYVLNANMNYSSKKNIENNKKITYQGILKTCRQYLQE